MTYNPRTAFVGQALPPVIRRESVETMLAAVRASYLSRNPEWIDDGSDPASEPLNLLADLQFRVMQRWNTGVVQLSVATADGGNLDALAGNVGLARLPDEADDTLRQRVAAHRLSANIATRPALHAAVLAQDGILDVYSPRPGNGQDFEVYVRTAPTEAIAKAMVRTEVTNYLNDDSRALAGWTYTVEEAVATRFYAWLEYTYNSTVTPIATLRPALEGAVLAYLNGLRINEPVHINRMEAAAIGAGALNATATLGLTVGGRGQADLPIAVPPVKPFRYFVQDDAADVVFTGTDTV